MAYSTPLNTIPYMVDTPDGHTGQLGGWRQARYINAYLYGRQAVYLGGIQTLSVREAYNGFRQQASIGLDYLEPMLGIREITGALTRYQPRGLTLKRCIQLAYGNAPGLKDIRLDTCPVMLVISYVLVGANYNYGSPIDEATWAYQQVYFDDLNTDFARGPNDAVLENITFRGQAELFTEGSIYIATVNTTTGAIAKTP